MTELQKIGSSGVSLDGVACAFCKFFRSEKDSNYGLCGKELIETIWLVEQGDETADIIIVDSHAGSSHQEIKVNQSFGCIRFIHI